MNTTTAPTTIIPAALAMDDNYRLTIAPAAITARDELITTCRQLATVDAETCPTAQAYLGALQRLRLDVEKTRKALKERPLEIGRRIDAAAKEFLGVVADEETRLDRSVSGHARKVAEAAAAAHKEQMRQELLAMEARRKADAIAARMESERIAAEQAAAKAAQEAEDAARRAAAPDAGVDAMVAEAAAHDAAREAEALAEAEDRRFAQDQADRRAAEAAAMEDADRLRKAAGAKVAGVRECWDYEITSMRALVQHSYDTGKNLVDSTPRRAFILEILRSVPLTGTPPVIPGLSIFKAYK